MKEFRIDLVIKRMWDLGTVEVTVTAVPKPCNQSDCQPRPTFHFDFSAPPPAEGS